MSHTRHLLSALALSLYATSPAFAVTEFRGGGFLTGFSGCSGWGSRESVLVRYQPAGAPENHATRSRVSMFHHSGAFNYSFDFTPGDYPELGEWFTVSTTKVFGSGYTIDGVSLRLLESSPIEAITAGATTIFLAFEVSNFDGLTGCTARGRVALALD